MTSDAKIGLLLGLVFIFIIAFIINGLPNFKSEVDNNELTTTMVSLQNKQLGIGSGVADSEVLDRPRLLERSVLDQTPVLDVPSVQESLLVPQTIEVTPDASGNQMSEVRYTSALPGSNNSNSNLLIGMPERTKTIEIVAPRQEVVARKAPSVEENSLRQVTSDVVAKVKRPRVVTKNTIKAREYVVEDGDSLGSISKKFYGEKLGNTKASIDRIFTVNRENLKSPDAIFVGQKLIIPAIGGTATATTQKVSLVKKPLGSSMLERVKQIGRKSFGSKKASPVKVAGKKYVVQDGDNLWKIAHRELGDGSRFGEIAKMNQDVLKNQDSIVVGMTILLPKK